MVVDLNQRNVEIIVSSKYFTLHLHSIRLLVTQTLFLKYEYDIKTKG